MAARFTRGEGKLYEAYTEKLVSMVNYKIYEELTVEGTPGKWWGELTLTDSLRIQDGDRYIMELEDKRKGRCSLRRRINKAVILVPSRFFYLIHGTGPIM